MLKFMKHQQKLTPERIKKQLELFAYTKACQHGFPSKPSTLAYDPELKLLAVGTKNASITVYGAPGVEFYGQHESHEQSVTTICFVPGKAQLVTLCSDNSLHLWQIKGDGSPQSSQLVQLHTASLQGKLKRISVVSCGAGGANLLVGTEGGNTYLLSIANFTFSDNIIYQDVVMQNVPEEFKLNPGAVESLEQHPSHPDCVLIGYQRGLSVLWHMPSLTARQTYVSSQQLEDVSWHSDGTRFISCHNDGSVTIWPSQLPPHNEEGQEETEKQPEPLDGPNSIYGPFPCKPITKVSWLVSKGGSDLLVFGGGMQRASHGDRHTVTVMNYCGEADSDSSSDLHVTFSFSSKVMDFCVTSEDTEERLGVAGCLVVLCEEEIVFIDLSLPDWPSLPQPFLCSLHSSAITCTALVPQPSAAVYAKIRAAGASERERGCSEADFPTLGGTPASGTAPTPDTPQDILLTGHEDGTVRVWCGGGVCVSLLHTINTAMFFANDDLPADDGAGVEDDDWPPFRKTGLFDPYSDDPRLGVKKVEMCGLSGQLVVAGTAGQVLVLAYNDSETAAPVKLEPVEVNLVAENDNFVWKSHNKLDLADGPVLLGPGLEVQLMLQLQPPASCTSLHLHSEWSLIAVGTAHGFALADITAGKNLLAKSTLSSLDIANAADEGPMSRRKSLKKSLRESFRRLRRGRSTRKTMQVAQPRVPAKSSAVDTDAGGRSVERAIEARQQSADYIGSMVRCLHLSKCFIANSQVMSATLWAGTNSGAIYVFTIAIPPSDKRKEVPITVQLGKEIHLKHAAPVLSVTILDGNARPFPPPLAVKKEMAPSPDTSAPHKVLICSEEQFKVFTLPQLKPFCKYKLSAIDGSRVRKIGFADFVSSVDPNYKESSLMVVTNQGDASVFSLPDCRRQITVPCFKKEDIIGINSCVFSSRGEALFLTCPSELMRVSLSAAYVTQPRSKLVRAVPAKSKEEAVAPKVVAVALPPAAESSNDKDSSKDDKKPSAAADSSPAKNKDADEKLDGCHTLEVSGPGSGTKLDEMNGGDTSLLSGDITIDSIRDHMVVGSNTTLGSNTTIGSGQLVVSSAQTKSLTVVKTSSTITTTQSETTNIDGETSTVTTVETTNNCTGNGAADTAATVNGTAE